MSKQIDYLLAFQSGWLEEFLVNSLYKKLASAYPRSTFKWVSLPQRNQNRSGSVTLFGGAYI